MARETWADKMARGQKTYYAPGDKSRSFTKDQFMQRYGYDPEQYAGGMSQTERDSKAQIERLKAEAEAMPQLPEYKGLSTLGEKGVYTPQLIQGVEIQRQLEESPWYRMALQKQAAEEAQRVGAGARQAQTSMAQARAGLAARGGLRGGAAERLAGRAGENLMLTRQNILGQGAVERSGLGMQGTDLASRIAQQNVAAQNAAREFNVKANILDLAGAENRALKKYEEEMKLKGGEAAARAQTGGGKGGIFG